MAFSDYYGMFAAIGGAICFGLGNVIIKWQGGKIKPYAINAIRLIFSSIVYLIILAATGVLVSTFSFDWKTALLLSGGSLIAVLFGDTIFFFSQQLIGLSRAYPIAVSYPLLTYIIAMIIGDEQFDYINIIGVVLVIIGVYLIASSTSKKEEIVKETIDGSETNDNRLEEQIDQVVNTKDELAKKSRLLIILGIVGAIITAISWTLGTIMMSRALVNVSDGILVKLQANAYRIFCIAPIATIVFFVGDSGNQKSEFSWKGVLFIILAGIIGNTAGSLLYLLAVSYLPASTTAAITASSPLIATPLSIIFLKEKFSWKLIIGTVLTIGGIWLILYFTL
ncbi:MAG: DMT family transporter [Candidatus Heimdallarchaeota archaeon]